LIVFCSGDTLTEALFELCSLSLQVRIGESMNGRFKRIDLPDQLHVLPENAVVATAKYFFRIEAIMRIEGSPQK